MNTINRKEIEDAGRKCGKNNSAYDSKVLDKGYTVMVRNLEDVFDKASGYDLSQYINFFDHWEEDQHIKKEYGHIEARYQRGDILYVDFGSFNFGYELSYPHPCIVLSENIHFILVVPCTTKKCGKNYFDIVEGNASDGLFSHCGAVIDGLRWVSKHRIIAKIGKAHDDYVDKIEDTIYSLLSHISRKTDNHSKAENEKAQPDSCAE